MGCAECVASSREGLKVVHEELRDAAFTRVEFYQHDRLLRCDACGTHWLSQYWEYDTDETRLQEWGVRERAFVALSASDVAEIEQALRTGTPMPHDRFRAARTDG